MGCLREAKPPNNIRKSERERNPEHYGCSRGALPLFRKNLPLPLFKGKGIKGIGL
jgi:hypothetical protein